MIYIATVHWLSDKWIDIQLEHLKKNITQEFRVFAWLNDIPQEHNKKFYYFNTSHIVSHATKLNILADEIITDSNDDDDIIIFLDGDAFPIADILSFAKKYLTSHPLLAVRRTEEDGEKQPHPCFCLTTIKFWKEIKGDWESGFKWKNDEGLSVTDVGGNLLGMMIKGNVNWLPIERTNRKNIHPVLFAVYGDLIYHHGAGFRLPDLRVHKNSGNKYHLGIQQFIIKYIPRSIRSIVPAVIRNKLRSGRKLVKHNEQLSHRVYNLIQTEPLFISNLINESSVLKTPTERAEPLCIIILGMHRSGTSCLAGSLLSNGLYTGDINVEDKFNASTENAQIVSLHKELLKFNNCTWDKPKSKLIWNSELIEKRDTIIKNMSHHAPYNIWGFKDPRTILTLPFWIDGLGDYKIIATYRNPVSVALSLADRGDVLSLKIEQGLNLWLYYNSKLLEYLERWEILLVCFDITKEEYEQEIKRILSELAIIDGLSNYNQSFYNKSLVRNNSVTRDIIISEEIAHTYKKLNKYFALQKVR